MGGGVVGGGGFQNNTCLERPDYALSLMSTSVTQNVNVSFAYE